MSDDEGLITIEIRGSEKAAVEAPHRISDLFLSSGPCRLKRTPGEEHVEVRVYADVARGPKDGGTPIPSKTTRACGFSVDAEHKVADRPTGLVAVRPGVGVAEAVVQGAQRGLPRVLHVR
ncbi:hypothetical protein GCM10010272_65940 [Streptomyces lateritius]|nr:hypothetical protein GCM10010272_65940 [Streptomyces lateritius]